MSDRPDKRRRALPGLVVGDLPSAESGRFVRVPPSVFWSIYDPFRFERLLDAACREVARRAGPYIMPSNNHIALRRTVEGRGGPMLVNLALAEIRREFARLWGEG